MAAAVAAAARARPSKGLCERLPELPELELLLPVHGRLRRASTPVARALLELPELTPGMPRP